MFIITGVRLSFNLLISIYIWSYFISLLRHLKGISACPLALREVDWSQEETVMYRVVVQCLLSFIIIVHQEIINQRTSQDYY